MPLTAASANALLDYWGTNYAKNISLHSAYSATGGNELSGGTYARLAATWASAASGSKSLSGTYNLNAPASSTVAWIGFWDALTSGNFTDMIPAGNAIAYAFAAPASTSVLLAPGSSYAANQQVVVLPTGGSTLPTGLTAGTIYWTKSPSGDSFQLAATSGGSAISVTGDGSGIVQVIVPEVFGSAGTFTLSSATVSLV